MAGRAWQRGVAYILEWQGRTGRGGRVRKRGGGVVYIMKCQGRIGIGVCIHTGMASPQNEVACDLASKTCWSNFFHTGYIQVSEIQGYYEIGGQQG